MKNILSAVVMMSLLGISVASSAATLYVSPAGSDTSNVCKTLETPCMTLERALDQSAVGDTIQLVEGVYVAPSCQYGVSKAVTIRGGYNADFSEKSDDSSLTVFTSNGIAGYCRLFAVNSGQAAWLTFDTLTMTGVTNADSHTGVILTHAIGGWVRLINVVITGNNMAAGAGAIAMDVANDKLEISNSVISNNTSTNSAAIYSKGSVDIFQSVIANNQGSGDSNCGAGIKLTSTGTLNMRYSTVYNNTPSGTCAGGVESANTTDNSVQLLANLITGNGGTYTYGNIKAAAAADIKDNGYNLIGSENNTFSIITLLAATSIKPTTEQTVAKIVTGYGYYGGMRDSVKLVKASPARNIIPYDGIPFYGVGKDAQYPFTSLSQAHGALKSVNGYLPGVYYFDLGGSYNTTLNPVVFTPGVNANGRFTTYVDADGYVLVASADISINTAAYTQTYNMVQRSDLILDDTVLKHPNIDVSEVRISSYSGGERGDFDGYSTSASVISKIKAFQTLPNTAEAGGTWVVTHSSLGTNYFTGIARAVVDQSKSLDAEIYYANTAASANGLSWAPAAQKEALKNIANSGSTTVDGLDLWVRGSGGMCNGAMSKVDVRGLPRTDRVSEDKAWPNCDIGSYEYNDFYQVDCLDEDGLRPENTLVAAEVGVCFKDPSQLTPRNMLDNFGAINYMHILMLILTGFGLQIVRRKKQ